ncbi:hypothetical protein RMSM_01755 [Rhodopirellula maiorica SM1]|uniref:Uncharacterized protein n=1 Tax=Rhodopirellula maiorica SM1 TaxID=1265738 RepID=M5RPW2_9BACT|nr:hypothetical protein RMSM_01755 [Rhodopirellula maiorica SM1]
MASWSGYDNTEKHGKHFVAARREPNAIYFGSGTRQSSWCFSSKDGNSGESHYLSIL